VTAGTGQTSSGLAFDVLQPVVPASSKAGALNFERRFRSAKSVSERLDSQSVRAKNSIYSRVIWRRLGDSNPRSQHQGPLFQPTQLRMN
jgi:hypothetical protein